MRWSRADDIEALGSTPKSHLTLPLVSSEFSSFPGIDTLQYFFGRRTTPRVAITGYGSYIGASSVCLVAHGIAQRVLSNA